MEECTVLSLERTTDLNIYPMSSDKSKKLLGIRSEYIQKYTPDDNGDIESFHNSLKTDYVWPMKWRH